VRWLAALALLAPTAALAGGTVAGTVTAAGAPTPPAAAKVTTDGAVCGKDAASEALLMAPGGRLANVVVSVKGLRPAQPPAPVGAATLDQVGCRYIPHVQAVTLGTRLEVLNSDGVLHNVHGTLASEAGLSTVFNVAMPFKGGKSIQVLRRAGPIRLRCDAGHAWMNAYVVVFDHPYHAVTDPAGRFVIKDVPPGKHLIEYWHEPLDDKHPALVQTASIDVADGKTNAADATLSF
jgi:hypothetical protein